MWSTDTPPSIWQNTSVYSSPWTQIHRQIRRDDHLSDKGVQMRHQNTDWTPITKCRWSHKTNMVAASQFSHVPIFQQHWWLYTVRKQNARLKEKMYCTYLLNIHAWDSGYFLKHCSIKLQILYIKAWPNMFHTVNYLHFIRHTEVYIWKSNHNNTQYNARHCYIETL